MSEATTETRSYARRGGRGGASAPNINAGPRGGSGGGRRKNNTNASRAQTARAATNNSAPSQAVPPKDDTSLVATATTSLSLADTTNTADSASDGEVDVCWLCAETVKFYSVAECNHRTCHTCAVRLRALYKKMDCAFCKVSKEKRKHA